MKSIFDRSFHYTPSFETDVKKTFAKIRRQQRQIRIQAAAETKQKVLPIRQNKIGPGA
jgi:hypothetical protein